jgi:SAM-dependent methyltransferase
VVQRIRGMGDTGDYKILDIGAGPGTHAIPLSDIVSKITAIEPAEGMFSYLHRNIKRRVINNITCIKKQWEDVDTQKDIESSYDVAIASFSLGMADIESAIAKINQVTSGHVFIVWHAGIPDWERIHINLWPALYGIDYISMPKNDCLLGVLKQMGVNADVSYFEVNNFLRFSCFEAAFNHYLADLAIETSAQAEVLRNYLDAYLIKKNDHVLMDDHGKYAIVSWCN